jgi:excisionase family DNA binding protein
VYPFIFIFLYTVSITLSGMDSQLASFRRRERMGANPQVDSQEVVREEIGMREWISLREMQQILGIGKTKAYELVATGEIPSVRIGRSIRVSPTRTGALARRATLPEHCS